MNSKLIYILLTVIIFAGFLIRVVNLDLVPSGLNRDEAAMGYNAYTLLKNGTDEHGKSWPISLESFGDWKLLPYPALVIPFISLLDLSETSTRLPSALFGTLSILMIFLIVVELFKDEKKATWLALLSATFFAFLPWNIFFSRAAYESNVCLTFFLIGLFFLLKSLKKPPFSVPASVFFSFSIFTYYGAVTFVPLFLLGVTLIFFYPKFKVILNKWYLLSIGVFLISLLTVFSLTQTGWGTRNTGIGIMSQTYPIYKNVDLARNVETNLPSIVSKSLHNKGTFFIKEFGSRYLNFFSPQFLVETGGQNSQHNIKDSGNITFFDFLVMFVGIFFLLTKRNRAALVVLFWLFLSPFIGSITKDGPHYTRSIFAAGAIPIVGAYGLYSLINKNKLFALLLPIYFLFLIFFLNKYFWHFPVENAENWNYGRKEVSNIVLNKSSNYKNIYFSDFEESPYIFLLFYGKTNPADFIKNAKYYPTTTDGFRYLKSYNNFIFLKDINWGQILERARLTSESDKYDKYLYVGTASDVPNSLLDEITKPPEKNKTKPRLSLLETIKYPNGENAYYIFEASLPR